MKQKISLRGRRASMWHRMIMGIGGLVLALNVAVAAPDDLPKGTGGNGDGNNSDLWGFGLVDQHGNPLHLNPDDKPGEVSEVRGLILPKDYNAEDIGILKKIEGGKHFDSLPPQEKRDLARRFLNDRVIGQQELIGVMLDLEQKLLMDGLGMRETPEIIYMLGLPGTGKDTMAKAYTDLRTRPGGHREHMYYLPVARKIDDLWRAFGSNTGYKGSDEISDLIKWLVRHSGGRYEIVRDGDKESVIESEGWYPTKNPPEGYKRPEDAVLYVDEFHEWSKEAKSGFLKQGLEKGYWPINNPGQGVSSIYVPITILIASNEGIGLLGARDVQGNRIGDSLAHEDLHRKWTGVHRNKKKLKKTIMTAGANKDHRQQTDTGIEEALLNRVPDSHIVLMEPLSPDQLIQISGLKLDEYKTKYEYAEGDFGPIDVVFSEGVANFITHYQLDAEAGGRAIEEKVSQLIEKTVRDVIFEQKELKPSNKSQSIKIDVRENTDSTFSLTYEIFANERKLDQGEVLIEHTVFSKPPEPMSQEQIQQLRSLPDRINERVFNLEHVAERMGTAMMVAEERSVAGQGADTAARSANTYMFLGLSSTGKTEAAKVTVEEISKVMGVESDALKIFDFSQIQTEAQLRNLILGTKLPGGGVERSPFMEHYDRYGGKAFFMFDESANTPRHVLRVLYDILREPVVTTFADGESRSMANVTIFMTGNAGEEWFLQIPRDIPKSELRRAMTQVYVEAMSDPGYRRQFLEQFFSPALLNRIGLQNIFFFPPHTFKSTRQMTLLKLGQAMKGLRPTSSGWGWDVEFMGEADYLALVNAIETDGFEVNEQGASIDRYAKQTFAEKLRGLCLKYGVPNGSKVVLAYAGRAPQDKTVLPRHYFTAFVPDTGEHFEFWMEGIPDNQVTSETPSEKVLTAYHEAGHSMARVSLMGDKYEQTRISIIPGVGKFGNKWIRYLGVAESESIEYMPHTRRAAIEHMAVLLAGEQAEYIASGGYSGGKSNDIERATSIAYNAILRYGLSEVWGNQSIPSEQSMTEYVNGLNDSRREILHQEVEKLLLSARQLAYETLSVNWKSGMEPLAVMLAEKGDIGKEELRAFYGEREIKHPGNVSRLRKSWLRVQGFVRSIFQKRRRAIERRGIRPHIAKPGTVASIEALIQEERLKEVAEVEMPENRPIAEDGVAFDEKAEGAHERLQEVIKDMQEAKEKRLPQKRSPCPGSFMP